MAVNASLSVIAHDAGPLPSPTDRGMGPMSSSDEDQGTTPSANPDSGMHYPAMAPSSLGSTEKDSVPLGNGNQKTESGDVLHATASPFPSPGVGPRRDNDHATHSIVPGSGSGIPTDETTPGAISMLQATQ